MKRILLLLAILPMSSCSLIFEAADISVRKSKEASTSDQLAGDGFTVRPPESGLYPSYGIPLKGGVTLRPTTTGFDGLVYYVSPFASATAKTTDEAMHEWNSIWSKQGARVEVVERTRTAFAGRTATRCVGWIRKGSEEHAMAFLMVKRDSDFLVIGHGNANRFGKDRSKMNAEAKSDLGKLIQGTKLATEG